jgi:hypothetical protein
MFHGDRLETPQSYNGSMLMQVDMDIMLLEVTAPQKGNISYLIARRCDTLDRTQYNTHNNLTTVTQNKLRSFSPQANYTHRATAACRRS